MTLSGPGLQPRRDCTGIWNNGTKQLEVKNSSTEDNMADQGDPFTDDGESSEENSHSDPEMKTSVGLKELQVCVTDINVAQPDDANGASVKRGRGRPKGSVNKAKINGENSPKKRGRPKSSTVKAAAGDMNGGAAKRPRGRPKGSVRNVDSSGEESDDSFSPPRKRGRPKGSFKKPKYETENSSENEAVQSTPKRGPGRPKKGPPKRGRPKKISREGVKKPEPAADGTQPSHKRPGRPKGSKNKPVVTVRVENTSGRPIRAHVPPDKLNISLPRKYPGKGRGRPKKSNRGRPRKRPLPPGEELYQPRVWKALGRPRKYPKEERPETAPALDTPRRGRGRPRKSESKKGAHLRKLDSDGLPRKAEHPPKAAKEQDGPPRKRGRPKGSFKNKTYIDNSSVKMSHDSDHSPQSEPLEEDDIE